MAQYMLSVHAYVDGVPPPSDQSTVVRENDGQIVMTDGPFVEAREHLGGFWVIRVDDRDAALEWASRATRACRATIEVRQFEPDSEV